MSETTRLKQRRNAAQRERDEFQPLLDEAYQYAIPFRKSANSQRNGRSRGEKRVDQVFDHTAIDSAFRFAGKLQQDFWPAGQDNFQLEPGPVIVNQAERDDFAKQLAPIASVAGAFFDDGDWDMSFHEMALELSAGTGAILMDSSTAPDKLWEPMSVPVDEILLENGPRNRISGIFWTRKMSLRVIKDTWPRAKLGEELQEMLKQDPEKEIEVYQDTIHDARKGQWVMTVWCKQQDGRLHQAKSRTCPWLVPRYFRVPGETYGRGPVMLAMPTIKTLNTTARLQLQAAAITMLGIYTAVDDGVFNPDLATQAPGSFWKVARNGGSLGPSVQRFPDPRLDLSDMVLNDMRMGVKATMMDQSLPAEGAAVRSATEILERVKRLASDHLGAYGRLVKEVTIPAVKRVLELAYNRGLIADEIPIDQLLIRVRIKSPLAIAREAQRIEKIVQWLQMVLMIMADRSNRVARVEQALVMIGRDFGVPETLMVSDKERDAMDTREQEMQAAAIAAQAAGAAGGT
ncbi:portal protein [Martelella mangrovi]|uniref:Head-to-tail connecting protein n=1 Tax=Martelella mangrovi TaxID=1397477 RepID=A0ABV2IEK9_9HYPH